MGLNLEKLENVKHRGSRIIARCPACAEQGHDQKGNHLFIDEQGRFSCVIYPAEAGKEHRKRIYELIGTKNKKSGVPSTSYVKPIKVRKATYGKTHGKNYGKVIKSDILGHLGRVNQTHAYREKENKDNIYDKDIEKGVPTVPDIETELIPISDETLRDVFLEVMHRISDNYIEGTIKYIQEYHKDFDDVINTIDIQINEIWEKCNVGKASLDDFRNSLALYENIYKEAIEIYKKVKQ